MEHSLFRLWQYMMANKHDIRVFDATVCLWLPEDEMQAQSQLFGQSGRVDEVRRIIEDAGVAFEGGYAEGSFLWIVNHTFFQYYSIVILMVCIGAMVAVSYATAEPDYARISGLTYGTLTEEDRRDSRGSWTQTDVLASVGVLLAILAAYLYFSG